MTKVAKRKQLTLMHKWKSVKVYINGQVLELSD